MKKKKRPKLLKLKGRIVAESLTMEQTAEKTGISYSALRNKLNGDSTFTTDEISDLVEILNIDLGDIIIYFFPEQVRNAS